MQKFKTYGKIGPIKSLIRKYDLKWANIKEKLPNKTIQLIRIAIVAFVFMMATILKKIIW